MAHHSALRLVRMVLVVALSPVLIAASLSTGTATQAVWNDVEVVNARIGVGTVPPPGALSCSGGGSVLLGNAAPAVTFSWAAAVPSASASLAVSDYSWTLIRDAQVGYAGTSPATARTAAITGGIPTGTYTFTVMSRGPGGLISAPGPTGTYSKADLLGLLLTTSSCTGS